jgi:hypothetical protein
MAPEGLDKISHLFTPEGLEKVSRLLCMLDAMTDEEFLAWCKNYPRDNTETIPAKALDIVVHKDEDTNEEVSWGILFEDGSTKWYESLEEAEYYYPQEK